MKLPVYDITGKQISEMIVEKTIFSAKVNQALLAQTVRVYLSNQRMASARAQTRAEVSLTGKKMYRQKGTGNARHGSKKAPIFVGGGKAHGPKLEQNYKLSLPQKMRKAALRSALSLRAEEKNVYLIEGLKQLKEIKTKTMNNLLKKIFKDKPLRKLGLIIDNKLDIAHKSARNIAQVNCIEDKTLTAYQVLDSRSLLIAVESLENLNQRLKSSKK